MYNPNTWEAKAGASKIQGYKGEAEDPVSIKQTKKTFKK